MQLTTIILIGIMLAAACAAKAGQSRNKPAWSEHLKGWQKVFGLAAFILMILIMMNPEFLALGLLGDAAFFDILVLALSLQLRSVVFGVWQSLHVACSKILSFAICGVRRDFSMLLLTLAPLGSAVLRIRKVTIKSPRQQLLTL